MTLTGCSVRMEDPIPSTPGVPVLQNARSPRPDSALIRAARPFALSLLIASSACGKSDGAPGLAPGLEAQTSTFVYGTNGLPSILADLNAGLRAIEARAAEDLAGTTAPFGRALTTEEGWRELGIDPSAELAIAFDQRLTTVGEGELGLAPLLIFKLDDRNKLIQGFARAGLVLELGAETEGVTPLLFRTKPVAYVARLGERTVIAVSPTGGDVTDALKRFIAGGGDKLEGAAPYTATMKDGAVGAGVYAWLSDMNKVEVLAQLMDVRRSDRRNATELAQQFVSAVGLQVGQRGVSLRVMPTAGMKEPIAKVYAGTAKPRDLGALVPARGWAALRMSVDPNEGLSQVLSRLTEEVHELRSDLGKMGFSLDELLSVLSGDLGVAIDVQSAVLSATMRGKPRFFVMVGIAASEKDKAHRLVESLVGVAEQMGSKRRRFEAAGETLWEIGSEYGESVYIAATTDMILVAQSESVLVEALERRSGDNLSKTPDGALLRQRLAVAAVADLAPLVALLEGDVMGAGSKKAWRGQRAAAAGIMATAGWKAFRERPIVTLEVGVDDGVVFTKLNDGGLSYGALLGALAGQVVKDQVRTRDVPEPPTFRGDGVRGE